MRECSRESLRESVCICARMCARVDMCACMHSCAGRNMLLTRFHMWCIRLSQHPTKTNSAHAQPAISQPCHSSLRHKLSRTSEIKKRVKKNANLLSTRTSG